MIDIAGSQKVKIKSVRFQTGYAHSSGGYGFSVKLEPNPPNGKSCQVVFGDMGPNKYSLKDAPASCEDLQLTTNSEIGVSKQSNQLTSCVICPLFKLTPWGIFQGHWNKFGSQVPQCPLSQQHLSINKFRPNSELGTIQVLRHQRDGWVGSENDNFWWFTVL